MTYLDPAIPSDNHLTPAAFLGAASPLWGYFVAMTAGGAAFWWMTRWAQPFAFASAPEERAGAEPDLAPAMAEPVLPAIIAPAVVTPSTLAGAVAEAHDAVDTAKAKAKRAGPDLDA